MTAGFPTACFHALFLFQSFALELAYFHFLASFLMFRNARVYWMVALILFVSIVDDNRLSDRMLRCLFLSIYAPGFDILSLLSFCTLVENWENVWMIRLIVFDTIVDDIGISDRVLPCFLFLSMYCL